MLISEQLASDRFRILSEVHDRAHDNPLGLHFVKNAVWEISNEHPAVSTSIDWGKLRVLTHESQGRIQMAHEHFAPSFLELLVTIEGGLNIVVSLEQ